MKKYSFFILVVLSLTTFFGFLIYYRLHTDMNISLVNEYGDINNLGDVELRLNQNIDSYRRLEISFNKEGLTKGKYSYTNGYIYDFIDKNYKELARGEKIPFGSFKTLENNDFQALSILSNESDTFNYESVYTHKVIIRNKSNGKIVKNIGDSFDSTNGGFFSIDGAVIIEDKLYALINNTYYTGEDYDQQRQSLKLLIYELNTGEKIEENEIINDINPSEIYTVSEKGNIFFKGNKILANGRNGGIGFYKYNILQKELEEIKYSKRDSGESSSNASNYFSHTNIVGIREYGDNIYLIDIDNNIMCLDKDYNIITNFSIRKVLREYGKLYTSGNVDILVYEDKLYFSWIENEFIMEDEAKGSKNVIAVISIKDNSVLYYCEILSKEAHSDEYSWRPLLSRGFHIN
ncbi:MAG: hypothetical protein ACI33K_13425 [Clostridiaceae bacterium]